MPRELIEKWQIGVVPAFINYGGQSYADDGIEFDRVKYYHELPHMPQQPTTAAPPPALAEKIMQQTFEGADHLVIISVPATLSGIYNSFRLAASSLPPDRVTQIDSGTVSMGLGFQVLAGAEVAAETGDVSAVVAAIERVRRHQKVYAGLATMEYLRRSGRLSWAAASVGALLQIKPVVQAGENVVTAVARVRTFAKVVDKLIELTQAEAPLERLVLLHTNNPDGALDLKARLGGIVPDNCTLMNATPAIGTHIGPMALGVATLSKAWRN
jgi:DegV family protein with EDD domain